MHKVKKWQYGFAQSKIYDRWFFDGQDQQRSDIHHRNLLQEKAYQQIKKQIIDYELVDDNQRIQIQFFLDDVKHLDSHEKKDQREINGSKNHQDF